ncbi:MAG: glycosyltransferase family 4 protein [Acidobacteria bacterium]|nr:glycosyltransferase family 4 protein [Acidobacteriota bacterium]MBV9477832.1 glycosyltransferase family 4 protein [Acidobacteriota bacterium]
MSTYPEHAAATRYRLLQYVAPLAAEGIALDVRPFLTDRVFDTLYDRRRMLRTAGGITAGIVRRACDVTRLGAYDAAFVQREAALIGPPFFEWLVQRRMPLVLDLDDSTYIGQRSDVFGVVAALLKSRKKPERLIRWSEHVVCGNPTIAAYVAQFGVPTTVLPTIVDVARFVPRATPGDGVPVIGWIGTHSTFAYFRRLVPLLEALARRERFRVRIVGAGVDDVRIAGVEVESLPWKLERELADLQSFDVAVYPIASDAWAAGKSGFKAIQYLSCGIPYVASPVGVTADIGVAGETNFFATTDDEWIDALARLLRDAELRAAMARRGRAYAVEHYSRARTAEVLAGVLRAAAEKKRSRP